MQISLGCAGGGGELDDARIFYLPFSACLLKVEGCSKRNDICPTLTQDMF